MYTQQQWLALSDREVAGIVGPQISTVVVYLNGTRRWFLNRSKNWADYPKLTSIAQRTLSQHFYDHGIQTLIQPWLGYDLLDRGPEYLALVVEHGLARLASSTYRDWFHQGEIGVTFYGNWVEALSERGFVDVVRLLAGVVDETACYVKNKLVLGAFADEGLDNIVRLAKEVDTGEALIKKYYGQLIKPVDLIIGSGQPAIWDLPLLDVNKASLYFLQAPTFCLNPETLRRILYDHLYQRVNDDEALTVPIGQLRQRSKVLGIGEQTEYGWSAL